MFTYVIVTCHLIPCSCIHSQSLLLHSQSYFATILISQSVPTFSVSPYFFTVQCKKKKNPPKSVHMTCHCFPCGLIDSQSNPHTHAPKGGRGCLMSPFCLESQGCHLISFSYLLSCVCVFSAWSSCFFCLVIFLLMVHSPDFSRKL